MPGLNLIQGGWYSVYLLQTGMEGLVDLVDLTVVLILLLLFCDDMTVYLFTDLFMDVTSLVFTFDDVQTLTAFQLFDSQQIVGSILVKCKYFISFNLIELY